MLAHPLTQYMLCSPGEGAARWSSAAGSTSTAAGRPAGVAPLGLAADAARRLVRGLQPVAGLEIAPRRRSTRRARPSRRRASGPGDVDVAQVQDTESGAELIHLAECGLCEHGEQTELYAGGATRIDGTMPVNTDGGCLANGEPVGASGLRQVYEVVLQLRGEAGERQVPREPKVGSPRSTARRASARARCCPADAA